MEMVWPDRLAASKLTSSSRRYAATTAVQANVRGVDGAYYFPGDGRAVYAGLSWRMP